MNTTASTSGHGGVPLPLPARQFKRFILVFHFVFVAGMCFVLFNRWQRAGTGAGWPEIYLAGLVVAQIALYVWFFALPAQAPRVLEWWGFYFPVCFSLWFITWQLEPGFEWIVLGYLGQMFGALAPRYSLPGGAAVFLLYLPAKVGWTGLGHMSLREWLGYAAVVLGWTALGLFLHKLAVTSAERAALIQELKRAKRELELAQEREVEFAGLRERERLARELHDSLGHGLVTLTVQLEAAQRLYASDPVRASALMDEMKRLTRTSTEQLRRSLAGLRAPGLGDRPLPCAIEELCHESAKRGNLKVECCIGEGVAGLPRAVAENLWRAAQEALANVERHARAGAASVTLELCGQATGADLNLAQVRLRVSDDGIGLPANAETKSGHYGLRGLRERIEGVGGTVTLSPGQPRGTVLEAQIPCPGSVEGI